MAASSSPLGGRGRESKKACSEHPSHVLPLAVRTSPPTGEEKDGKTKKQVGTQQTKATTRAGSAFKATESSEKDYDSSVRQMEPPAMGRTSPTLRRAWPKDGPLAAICVQSVDVQCVLQFTLIHAAGCVLHRRTSRVIHRLKLFLSFVHYHREATPALLTEACQPAERAFERFGQSQKEMRKEMVIKLTTGGGGTRTGGQAGLFKPSPAFKVSIYPLARRKRESPGASSTRAREKGATRQDQRLPLPNLPTAQDRPRVGNIGARSSPLAPHNKSNPKPDIPDRLGTPQSQFFGWQARPNFEPATGGQSILGFRKVFA